MKKMRACKLPNFKLLQLDLFHFINIDLQYTVYTIDGITLLQYLGKGSAILLQCIVFKSHSGNLSEKTLDRKGVEML